MATPGHRFKVVLLGEGAVGKSSLMLRYVENKFSPRHLSTIQASFLTKNIEVDGEQIELNIWDTAGQEKYHALGPIYYRGSNGALLIYDITETSSFDKVKMWIKELRRALGDSCALVIIGNKTDLERSRSVPIEQAKEYAAAVGAEYMETSAKENIGIANVFENLCRIMMTQERQNVSHRAVEAPVGRRTIELVDDDDSPRRRSKCCSK